MSDPALLRQQAQPQGDNYDSTYDQSEIPCCTFRYGRHADRSLCCVRRCLSRFYNKHEAIHGSTTWEDALEYFWSLSPANATEPREAFLNIQQKWPGVIGDPDSHYNFYFSNMVKFMKVLPGAVEFVDWMNSSSVNWGIVTNGDQFQHQKAEATGLDKKTPFVLASKLFGVNKPAPEVFMEAVRLLDVVDVQTEQILFVGDNPYTDITGAHGVGMKTAWVRMGRDYPDDAPAPDFIVDHVEELKPLLA